MTRFSRTIAATAMGLLFTGAAMADSLELKDGRVLTGRFLGGTQALMRFSVNGEVQTFNVSEIVALTFTSDYGNPPPPPPQPPPRASASAIGSAATATNETIANLHKKAERDRAIGVDLAVSVPQCIDEAS